MQTMMLHHAMRLFVPLLLIILAQAARPVCAAEPEPVLVGRISHIEGKVLRYIEEERDWVLTVKDAPFGLEDTLYADDDAKAEFILPNSTWIRVGEDTQIELIALNEDATTVDVASGLARFYNRSVDGVVKVTTPYGYVVALGDTVFDLYVGDESLEVVAVRGVVDFVHAKSGTKLEVREGDASLIADSRETALGSGTVDRTWDDWNTDRDSVWAKRLEAGRTSSAYLPAPLHDESYVLEENGRWERVYYEGTYRDLWRPTRINPGWRPYTAGRWVVYYGDHCWVPDEPFGYMTHHYGSWVYVESFHAWYWAPPAPRMVVDTPSVFISFGWYPGRVGWFHHGDTIGWVPLAPHEVYYGHRYWGGHRTVVVDNSVNININIGSYRYLDEAVVIPRDHFYRAPRYTPFVDRSINKTVIVNNYQPTTIINNTVINNYSSDRRRFALHDEEIVRKPHRSVVERKEVNQALRRDGERLRGRAIKQDLDRVETGTPAPRRAEMQPMTLTSRMVEANKVGVPIQELSRTKREIKPKEQERRIEPERRQAVESAIFPAPDRRSTRKEERQPADGPHRIGDDRTTTAGEVDSPLPADSTRGAHGRADKRPDGMGTPAQEGERRLRSPRETDQRQREAVVEVPEASERGRDLEEGEHRRQEMQQQPIRQNGERRVRSPREIEAQQQRKEGAVEQPIRGEERRGPRDVEDRRRQREIEQQQADMNQQPQEERSRQQNLDQQPPRREAVRQQRQQDEQRRQQEAEQQQSRQLDGRDRDLIRQQETERQQQEEGRRQREIEQQQADMDQQPQGERSRQQNLDQQPPRREAVRQQRQQDEQRRQQEVEQQQNRQVDGRDRDLIRQQEAERQQQQQEEGRRQQEAEQRKQQEGQRQQAEQVRRQQEVEQQRQQEGERRQQVEQQRRQQEAARQEQMEQQRQQQVEQQRRQQEAEQRKQQEGQRQQAEQLRRQQEVEQQRQQEGERRQQVEQQRRQQEAARQEQLEQQRQQQVEQQRRQQEAEQRKQQEDQRQQAEQVRRQQEAAQQRRQEVEQQRRQEGERRQQAEQQRRQQEAARQEQLKRQQQQQVDQQRRQQEAEQRKQQESQRQQAEQLRRQQQEAQQQAPPPQQKKSKKQLEEEQQQQQQQQQQQSQERGHGRNK